MKRGHLIPLVGGDEYDYLTRWRNMLHHKRGQARAAKRSYNRRVRRTLKPSAASIEDSAREMIVSHSLGRGH
jgi:hypothetical protein